MSASIKRMYVVEGSKAIHKIGFDPSTPGAGVGTLVVQFSNLSAYVYEAVKYEDYLALMNADSPGSEFQKNIKPRYAGKSLNLERDRKLTAQASVPAAKPQEERPLLDLMESSVSQKKKR